MTHAPRASDRVADAGSVAGTGSETTPQLRAQGLRLELGETLVLDRVDIAPAAGWTAVVGPNGAGKSTLLRVLAGLQRPGRGRVELDGRDVHAAPARWRAAHIAWLAQQADVGAELTVREIVHLGRLPQLGLFSAPGPRDEAIVDDALDETGSTPWQHRSIAALSGGERQRVLLARVLATCAPILLLDEPTTHLDPPHQVALARMLRRQAARGHVVVSVLHDLSLALSADRLVVMCQGRIRAEGSRDDPAVHAAIVDAFGGAVNVLQADGRWIAVPDFGG